MNASRATLLFPVTILAGVLVHAQVRQPEYVLHDRGQLWETMKDNGMIGAPNPTNRFEFFPSMDWPGGPHVLSTKDEQRSYNYAAGMWIGGKKTGGALFFTENGPFTYVDNGTFSPITRTTNFVESPGYNPNEAEEVVTAEWVTTENIRVHRVSRAWSFPGNDNFIIIEYRLTNQSGGDLTEVYAGFPYLLRPSYQDFVVHNGWGDDLNRADDLVRYDSVGRLVYSYDDTPNYSLPNDVGNYWAQVNELRTTGYAGVGLIASDAASDGRRQPANVWYTQLLGNERFLTLSSATPAAMYALLSGVDNSLQTAPDVRLAPFVLMSCGPYTIASGGSVSIVLVEAVNGLSIAQAMNGLAAQPDLPQGLDLLRGSVASARALYQSGYRVSPIPPPAPATEILSLPSSKSISITWAPLETGYANPLTGARNITGYRVYRSSRSFIGPFDVLREIDVNNQNDHDLFFDSKLGKWKVVDPTISLGVTYFYGVTSVDSLFMESGLTNRNETGIKAASSPSPTASSVKVFPNPFHRTSGFPTAGEENSIVWSGLPALATIHIFTASGEIIRTMKHNNTLSGEEVWDQLTDSRQRVAPGIYFWSVESPAGSARGTVLIIK
jgi:hypothetical protein